jgi:hypothetical protein
MVTATQVSRLDAKLGALGGKLFATALNQEGLAAA